MEVNLAKVLRTRCVWLLSPTTLQKICWECHGFVLMVHLMTGWAVPQNSNLAIWIVLMIWEGASVPPLVNAMQRRQTTFPPVVSVCNYMHFPCANSHHTAHNICKTHLALNQTHPRNWRKAALLGLVCLLSCKLFLRWCLRFICRVLDE